MTFWQIPDTLLDQQLGEGYDTTWTLRSELERYKEDIEHARWELWDNGSIRWFQAWSKTYVMVTVDTPFGDKVVYGIPRNPPSLSSP